MYAAGVLSRPAGHLPRFSRKDRRVCRVTAASKKDADYKQQGRPMQALQGALLAAVMTAGMGLTLPQEYIPFARADNSFVSAAERRKQEALQRKELLSKAREEALRKGGIDPSSPEAAPAPGPTAADAKVEAANAEVEASNKEREGLSSSMLQRLKKAAGDYEKTAGSGLKIPKEREPAGAPTWSSLFQSQEPGKTDSPAAPSPPASAPAPAAAPEKPLVPFQMPKFEAPSFEKVQVPSFGIKQELPTAPVAPPSPPPAPAAKVVPPPPPPPPPAPTPAPKVERAAPSPAASADEDSSGAGAWFKSLTETPTKPEVPAPAAPKLEAPTPKPVIKAPLFSSPEPEKKAAPAKKQVKAAAVTSKPGKRQGPLPLWLAELLIIFGLGGILYSLIRWSQQIEVYWGKLDAQLEALYEKIDKRPASPPKA